MIPQVKTILYTTAQAVTPDRYFGSPWVLAKQLGARIILLHVVEPLSNSVRFLIDSYLKPDAAKDLHQQASAGMLENIRQRMEAFCAEEAPRRADGGDRGSSRGQRFGVRGNPVRGRSTQCRSDHHGHAYRFRHADRPAGSTTRRITLTSSARCWSFRSRTAKIRNGPSR